MNFLLRPWPFILFAGLSSLCLAAPTLRGPETKPAPVSAPSAPAVTAPAVQPPPSDEAIAAFIDGYVSDAMDRGGIPGAGVVVVRDGRTILAKGYGYADFESRRAVTVENSLFRQASISKTFIWLLAMQLAEEGRLDLDRDVNAYLDFKMPAAFGKPVTMRHLMTHTPGFAERFWGVYEPDTKSPLGQLLRNNIPAQVYPPGSTVAYSNYGAALAAYIVERLRGRPFDELVRERIFKPAGMQRSTFAQPLPRQLRPLLVSGYKSGSRKPSDFEAIGMAPAGSLTASPGDMGRYLTMLLRKGEAPGGRILAPATFERMIALDKRLGAGVDAGFGHGFMVGTHRGVRHAGHAGNLSAAATDLEFLPDHGLGWHLAFNGPGAGGSTRQVRANLVAAVIDRFYAPVRPPVQARGPSSAREVAGSYLSTRRTRSGPLQISPPVEVEAHEDGSIRVASSRFSDGSPRRWLPAGRDRFVEEESGAVLAVARGPDGKVTRLASALLSPATELEPAPVLAALAPLLFGAALVILLFAALAQPAGWLLRKGYRVGPPAPSSRAARISRPLAMASVWLLLLTVGAWFLFFTMVEDLDALFTMAWARITLASLAALSGLFAALILADALIAWRDPARGRPRRIGLILVAIAAVALALLAYSFGFASFSTDY